MNIIDFTNDLDKTNLTFSEVEEQIKNFTLDFTGTKNEESEYRISFPRYITPFYEYVFNKQVVPTQIHYVNYLYISKNIEWLNEQKFSDKIMRGLEFRLKQTYPSLVRDLHFCLFLKEKSNFDNILYNIDLDFKHGIDILIKKENKNFGVNLYTSTRRGMEFREKKSKRHTYFDDVSNIELPVDFHGSRICGNFFLYGDREMNLLSKIIDSKLQLEKAMSYNL